MMVEGERAESREQKAVSSGNLQKPVIPAKAGIQVRLSNMDPRFRGDDGLVVRHDVASVRADDGTRLRGDDQVVSPPLPRG